VRSQGNAQKGYALTISTTSNTVVVQGNGLTTSFSFMFPVPLASELFVYYTDATGNVSLLNQSTYSVTGIGSAVGGAITYPLVGSPIATGTSLTIQRVVTYQQLTDLVNQSGFYPNVVENSLDYLTMQTQQLAQQLGLALTVPISASPKNLVLPPAGARANQLVGFDVNGNAITYPITASVGAGNLTSEGPFVAGVNFTPGVTTTLTLSKAYGTPANVSVHFDGTYQGTDQYSLNGTQIIFTSPIPVGVNKVYIVGGTTLSLYVPPNQTVGDAQLTWGNILNRTVDSIASLRALTSAIYTRAFVTGYYAAHDGGGGAYQLDPSDTTSADNGGTIIVAADGGRWKLQYSTRLSAKQWGVHGDGTTDDTAAFNNAIAHMAGQCLFVPSGTYLIAGTVNISVNNFKLLGEFEYGTTFTCSSASADVFDIIASDVELAGFNVVHSVTRTGGTTVNFLSGATHTLRDFSIFGAYTAISFSSTIATIRDGTIRNTVATAGRSIFVGATAAGFNQLIMNIIMDAPVGSQPAFGITVNQTNDLRIVQCEIQHQGTGMIISPGASQLAYAVWSDNTFFDSNVQRGVSILPSSTGSVNNVRFSNCWFGNNGSHGCEINNLGTGTCSAIHFVDPQCINNAGDGILLTNGDDVRINGGGFSQNANGFHVAANQSDWSIIGASLGNFGGGTGNSGHGITIDSGSSTNFVIADCDIRGNGGNVFDGSAASPGKYIHHNVGYKTSNSGNATMLSGNSSVVVSHGLDVQPQGYEILLTPTGSPPAAGISTFWISTVTATTFTISANASATSNIGFGWAVRTAGS